MAQYLVVYLGANPPASPEEGKQHYAKYQVWLSSLGKAVTSPANPLKNTYNISSDGTIASGSKTTISGYIIIQAETIKDVLALSQGRPFLDIGGTLKVSEMIQMSF